MRISDWSSDVCSSDLQSSEGDVDLGKHLHAAVEATHHGTRGCGGDQRNQQDAGTVAVRRSEEIVETRKSLHSDETDQGGWAQPHHDESQGVAHVSESEPHGVTAQGI